MNIINTVSSEFFTLNGIQHPRIYQPLVSGSENITAIQIFDSRFQLITSVKYDEFNIDTIIYGTQAATIAALLGVIYAPSGGGGAVNGVYSEIPSGSINGINKVFNLASVPLTGSLRLYVNGVRQVVSTHYAIASGQITFVTAPFVGDLITADYDI